MATDRFSNLGIDYHNAMQAAQQTAQQWPGAHQGNQITAEHRPSINVHARCRGMLLDRLGGVDGPYKLADGEFLMCHAYWGLVYVFFVFGKREGVTKESTDVFPSDKLVAQLRMVMIA